MAPDCEACTRIMSQCPDLLDARDKCSKRERPRVEMSEVRALSHIGLKG